MFGVFVAALGIRLASSVGGYEASQATLNAIAIILTTSFMRLAGIQAELMEPSMQSLRGMFLTPDFLVPVMIICFTTYKQIADFGCPSNILMLQAAEFALALIMDWAHIKTAIGPGQVARRGGGESNLPNLGAQPDSEWELLH
ncbi:hypothetical protein FRC05_008284 [Tulasnella sp. 425]|nr:hypothetical protein FRC05_008284 [Tulasnella sp. 425]